MATEIKIKNDTSLRRHKPRDSRVETTEKSLYLTCSFFPCPLGSICTTQFRPPKHLANVKSSTNKGICQPKNNVF